MIVAIHQPNFIPWIGYFYKIAKSDAFVFLDDVQYSKNSFINRNKIKTPQGVNWLTIPVKQAGRFGQTIMETTIVNPQKALNKVVKTIEQNYKKAAFFNDYFDEFAQILNSNPEKLAKLNMDLILWVSAILDFQTTFYISSEMEDIEGSSTDRLVSICKKLGGTVYFSGFGGMNYQEEEIFKKNNIQLKVTDFNHPEYKQLWGNFEKSLSIIDLIFNEGPKSIEIITG